MSYPHPTEALREHRAIYEALVARRTEEAVCAMAKHIEASTLTMLDAVDD
jgi:DNA-binding FadR family transcriptional regulator